jgi:hypothetical protein
MRRIQQAGENGFLRANDPDRDSGRCPTLPNADHSATIPIH